MNSCVGSQSLQILESQFESSFVNSKFSLSAVNMSIIVDNLLIRDNQEPINLNRKFEELTSAINNFPDYIKNKKKSAAEKSYFQELVNSLPKAWHVGVNVAAAVFCCTLLFAFISALPIVPLLILSAGGLITGAGAVLFPIIIVIVCLVIAGFLLAGGAGVLSAACTAFICALESHLVKSNPSFARHYPPFLERCIAGLEGTQLKKAVQLKNILEQLQMLDKICDSDVYTEEEKSALDQQKKALQEVYKNANSPLELEMKKVVEMRQVFDTTIDCVKKELDNTDLNETELETLNAILDRLETFRSWTDVQEW